VAAAATLLLADAAIVASPASWSLRVGANDFLLLLTSLLVAVTVAMAARARVRQKACSGAGWTLGAIGVSLQAVGYAIWTLREVILRQPPTPSLADVFNTIAYPCFFVAILLFPAEHPPTGVRLRTIADTATVMLAAGYLWWILGISPQLARIPAGATGMNVALTYPMLDLAAAWVLFVVLGLKFDVRDRQPARLLSAGVAVAVVSDVFFSYELLAGQAVTRGGADLTSVCYMLLFGLAGWVGLTGSRNGSQATAPPERIIDPPPFLSYAPYAAAITAYIALVAAYDRAPSIGFTATATGLGSITGLLLLRQWLAGHEIAQLNDRLRASEARYRTMVECQTDLIARWRTDGTLTYVNDVLPRYYRCPRQEVLGRGMLDLLPADERELLEASVAITSPKSPIFVTQTCVQTSVGEKRYVQWTHLALFEGGRIVELQSVGRDVTERERARQTLERWNDDLEGRVEARTAQLVTEMAERTRAQEALQQYATRLEASNRELQDFAYVASHDLQEPLRKIQAFGDRLRDRYSGALDEQGLDYLSRMQAAAARMQSLIDGLLAYSRVTTKAQPFELVDLNTVTDEVLADLETRVAEVQGTVEVGRLPTIAADPLQMRQLLQNLLANALKFHREDVPPIVHISGEILHRRASTVVGIIPESAGITPPLLCELRVQDNGIGFDEKYTDRIFQVFQRLHGRGAYEGAGIGLAVCRKIAIRHGGSIEAHSTPGQGSEFIVTLPISHDAEPAPPVP
jgi:PAS domain S-box-containing protein